MYELKAVDHINELGNETPFRAEIFSSESHYPHIFVNTDRPAYEQLLYSRHEMSVGVDRRVGGTENCCPLTWLQRNSDALRCMQ